VASGKFRPRDLAWRPGLTTWVPLHSLEKNRTTLSTTFATEPPPIPPWPVREKNKLFGLSFALCAFLFLLGALLYPRGSGENAPPPPPILPTNSIPYAPSKGERLEAVFFEQDSAVLDESGREVLERITVLLQGENYREFQSITLIGFASSEGEIGHNEGLSMARADSVKTHLMERGIPEAKIIVVPLGQANKGAEVDPNPKMNRRVEISVVR